MLTRLVGITGTNTVHNFDVFLPHDCAEVTHIGAYTSLTPALGSALSTSSILTLSAGELLFRRPDVGDFFLTLPVDLLHSFTDEPLASIAHPDHFDTGLSSFPLHGTQLHPVPTRVKGGCRFISGVYFDRINETLGISDYYPLLLNLRYRKR